jgi:sugar phosphate isomerase/epimerase
MQLSGAAAGHLTYCTNVHAGETLADVLGHVAGPIAAVARRCAADQPFGLGLRLAAAAFTELASARGLAALRQALAAHNLYLFTVNGFPYGAFHGGPVKANVYRPDWREAARLAYTCQLADALAALAPPAAGSLSLSTVPGGFAAECRSPEAVALIAETLLKAAAHLVELSRRTGQTVILALEPEPLCLLETVADTVAFFQSWLYSAGAIDRFAALVRVDRSAAETALRRHLGICLDACHFAVAYEDIDEAIDRLHEAGIPIAKVQLSSALIIDAVDEEAIAALAPFADAVYLHQVIERRNGRLRRFADLDQAFAHFRSDPRPGAEWRVHVHVPVFTDQVPPFRSSGRELQSLLARQRRAPLCEHLEVETYTWSVLPPALRSPDLIGDIVRELDWVRERLGQ